MSGFRIEHHPILPIEPRGEVTFSWKGKELIALKGETIAAALFANGIRTFGHHPKDGSPQGIYCANGQCAQCMVLADDLPVKACMELVTPQMKIEPLEGRPVLPKTDGTPATRDIEQIKIPVLIIGGGPAGLSAAIQLAKARIKSIVIDDKHRLGGKLVLQTHRFFGSSQDVFAGMRGIDIATRLEDEARSYPEIEPWLHSTAVAVFSDQSVGILRQGNEYVLVQPEVLLVAAGAREKSLAFKGNTLPGVYGAGAFQTLVNRDRVRPAERLFIVGGGNVGLIAGYHALQAGISVVGLAEALPECGGYKVHRDKLARMGVPIYTSYTILSADGEDAVEGVTIARVGKDFQPVPGTEKSFACDTVLIAVGLDPVNEFYIKAREFGMKAVIAGDAEEIAEASAAIFSGKIHGLEIAQLLGAKQEEIPDSWRLTSEILKSKPGKIIHEFLPEEMTGIVPAIHCSQEIPCNPCASICPHGLIDVDRDDIRSLPIFLGNNYCCEYCERCVVSCPGLAITMVNYRYSLENALVSIPYEFLREQVHMGDWVVGLDTCGAEIGIFEVESVETIPESDRTLLVRIITPKGAASQVAGIRVQDPEVTQNLALPLLHPTDDIIVCRCERVSVAEIRGLIRQGCRDINAIKILSRAGMGACGSKTCGPLIQRLFREEGILDREVVPLTRRPLFVEVPLGIFAGVAGGGPKQSGSSLETIPQVASQRKNGSHE